MITEMISQPPPPPIVREVDILALLEQFRRPFFDQYTQKFLLVNAGVVLNEESLQGTVVYKLLYNLIIMPFDK